MHTYTHALYKQLLLLILAKNIITVEFLLNLLIIIVIVLSLKNSP